MIGRSLGVVVSLAAALLLAPASAPPERIDSSALTAAVTVPGIREHLEALQRIADQNGGNRAFGSPGYAASVDYVKQRLTAAGYQVTTQRLPVPFFSETAPPVLDDPRTGGNRANGEGVRTMRYSGSGDVTAPLSPVDISIPPSPPTQSGPHASSGCEQGDFAGFAAGTIALMQRGGCPFAQKAHNAKAAGAAAAVIISDEPAKTVAFSGTLENPGQTIPVLGVSYPVGLELLQTARAPERPPVHVAASTISETRLTENVIADGEEGRDDRIMMVGAHLDSVPAGPGINDNGSGTATVLEIAEQLARLDITPRNRVRFAFWGAEELGLIGSEYYVGQLDAGERGRIAAYLNFDMVGSPNFVRIVNAPAEGPPPPDAEPDEIAPPGSDVIAQVFTGYFAARRLPYELRELDGRSDYGPFAAAGIPVGGVFSGAEGLKSAETAATQGGTVGQPYDSCYHSPCDTLGNINDTALDQLGDAAAHGVITMLQTATSPKPAG